MFDVLSSSDCPASTNITTTVFASNILGIGPPSNSTTSGHTIFMYIIVLFCIMVAIGLKGLLAYIATIATVN